MTDKQSRENAQQTFRQFAWNLAGTLASVKAGARPPSAKPHSAEKYWIPTFVGKAGVSQITRPAA